MRRLLSVVGDIESTKDMQGLVQTYEEIAAMRMQKIRGAILASREYFQGLAALSEEISTDLDVVSWDQKKKNAAVFIAANTGLYGDIVDKVFADFVKFVKTNKVDAYVVGAMGVDLMTRALPDMEFTEISMPDDGVDKIVFSQVVKQLLEYKEVYVFYGQFASIVSQHATTKTLSGELVAKMSASGEDVGAKLSYLYEPSVELISEKFGTEVFTVVFEQTLHESQLAKYASRLMHLDRVLQKTDKQFLGYVLEKKKVKRRLENKKQGLRAARVHARARM